MPYATQWLTSQPLERFRERMITFVRDLRRQPREAVFYFRVDDPYSWLLAQQLSLLVRETGLRIRPRTMLQLPAEMYPEPELYRQYSIHDAALSAHLHNLNFANKAAPSHSDAF